MSSNSSDTKPKVYNHLVVHLPNPDNGNAMEVWGTYLEDHKTFGKFENDELVGWLYSLPNIFVFVNLDGHPIETFDLEEWAIEWLQENFAKSVDYLPARQKVSEESQNDSQETAQSRYMD